MKWVLGMFGSLPVVNAPVAFGAQRDQVLLGIISRLAAKLFVVDFEIRQRPHNWQRQPSRRKTCWRSSS